MNGFRLELSDAAARIGEFALAEPRFSATILSLDSDREVPVVGSGCSLGVAALVAQYVREVLGRRASPMTPLEFVTTRAPDAAVFVSSQGEHPHTLAAARHLTALGRAVVVTTTEASPLCEALCGRVAETTVILPQAQPAAGGYAPVEKSLAMLGTVVGDMLLDSAAEMDGCRQCIDDQLYAYREQIAAAAWITILHAGVEKPAAIDLETRLMEGGLAFAAITDIWNYAHGRFNITTARPPSAFVAFASANTRAMVEKAVRCLRNGGPVVTLATANRGIRGSLCCYFQALELVACLAELRGIDVTAPVSPAWGPMLYRHDDET